MLGFQSIEQRFERELEGVPVTGLKRRWVTEKQLHTFEVSCFSLTVSRLGTFGMLPRLGDCHAYHQHHHGMKREIGHFGLETLLGHTGQSRHKLLHCFG